MREQCRRYHGQNREGQRAYAHCFGEEHTARTKAEEELALAQRELAALKADRVAENAQVSLLGQTLHNTDGRPLIAKTSNGWMILRNIISVEPVKICTTCGRPECTFERPTSGQEVSATYQAADDPEKRAAAVEKRLKQSSTSRRGTVPLKTLADMIRVFHCESTACRMSEKPRELKAIRQQAHVEGPDKTVKGLLKHAEERRRGRTPGQDSNQQAAEGSNGKGKAAQSQDPKSKTFQRPEERSQEITGPDLNSQALEI